MLSEFWTRLVLAAAFLALAPAGARVQEWETMQKLVQTLKLRPQ